MNNLYGWRIKSLQEVGKTEVLCESEEALKKLKAFAHSIPSSDVYPSFNRELAYTLFFFNIHPEFLAWLYEYVNAFPVKEGAKIESVEKRKFGIREFAASFSLLAVLISLFLFLSPLIVRSDVVASDAISKDADLEKTQNQVKNELEVNREADTIEITAIDVTDSITLSDSEGIVDTKPKSTILRRDNGRKLEIYFVDVGQGDGIIIKLPNGEFAVVDANAKFGGKIVNELKRLGCRKIKAVVATHPHADHIGGLAEVFKSFHVETFYDAGAVHPTSTYMKLLQLVEEKGSDYVNSFKPGQTLQWDPSCKVTVLHAGREEGTKVNNYSIVLRIEYGQNSVLLTGDAEKEVETEIIERFHGRIKSTVLKVGHHGSRSSSTPAFLSEVQPKYAVISCGTGNSYGHPTPQTLKNLEAIGAVLYRTDLNGTITAVSDGVKLEIKSEW